MPTVAEIRLTNIVGYLKPTVSLLNDLHNAFGTPFVPVIASTMLALVDVLQNVKRNKDTCLRLMEHIDKLLYALVNLHIKSEAGGSLPPDILHHIGKFAETLSKIQIYIEAQGEGNKLKSFFRQNEMNILLKDCHAGLQQAVDVFKIDTALTVFDTIAEYQRHTESLHQELLECISNLSEREYSDTASSFYQTLAGSQISSPSFSILPARPKIFHGRDLELTQITAVLSKPSARIAILGAGGMGKTSLARAILHQPDIASRYEHRVFIPCGSASNRIELAALVGAHVGLKPGKDLTKPVIQHFSDGPQCLLILDNLETAWEPKECRPGTEEFLSLLTEVPHLALIITIRGAERPAKVQWSHPFLQPLQPLSDEAARQTFIDIADDFHASEDINKLLGFTDNMPLAVELIAHLVDYKGCSTVIDLWEMEKTSLLSEGYDKRSNLDASIALSISSPRLTALPGAKDLLSLLSILPDGLSDIELLHSNLPIQNIMACKIALLRTSLAYIDDKKHLKSLVPIREHVRAFHPPAPNFIQPLQRHFQLLLKLYQTYRGARNDHGTTTQITSNIGNLQQILMLGLHSDNPVLPDTIRCTISFNSFRRLAGHGPTILMDQISARLLQLCDHRLHTQFITEVFNSVYFRPIPNADFLVSEGIALLRHFNDPQIQSKFYVTVGAYYHHRKRDPSGASQFFEKALLASREGEDNTQQAVVLLTMADLEYQMGNYSAARIHAHEGEKLSILSGNLYLAAAALDTEAHCYTDLGNYRYSILLCRRARRILGLCSMSSGLLDHGIMNQEAQIHMMKSEYMEAHNIHTQIIQSTPAEQDPWGHALSVLNLAEIDLIRGAAEPQVHENLDKARSMMTVLKQPAGMSYCTMTLAHLELRERNIVVARTLLEQSLNSNWEKNIQVVSYCLDKLADVNQWGAENMAWTSRWTTVCLAHALKSHQKFALHKALQFLGDVFLSQEDENTAHNLFIVALEGFTFMDVHRSRANCMLRLGDISRKQGKLEESVELWQVARPLFEQSLQTKDVAEIDIRLAAIICISETHVGAA